MDKRYIVKYNDNKSIEISEPNSSILCYKIPYKELKNRTHNIEIENRFIVYILYGKNTDKKDVIYVGKSKNGIDNRPTSHEDKHKNWTDCYILTNHKENTFLHDGAVQYIENEFRIIVDELFDIYENTTKQTNVDTVNQYEKVYCDRYIEKVLDMLYVLGLNLYQEKESEIIKEENVKDVNQNILLLDKELRKAFLEVNDEIKFVSVQTYDKVMLDDNILASIEIFKTRISIVYNCKSGELNDEKQLLTDISKIGHHGPGDYRIIIEDNKNFEDIKRFLNDIINL